jgi:hypothetical protein
MTLEQLQQYWYETNKGKFEQIWQEENLFRHFEDVEVSVRQIQELKKIYWDVIGSELYGATGRMFRYVYGLASARIDESGSNNYYIAFFYDKLCSSETLLETVVREMALSYHQKFLNCLAINEETKQKVEKDFDNFLEKFCSLQQERDKFFLDLESNPAQQIYFLKKVNRKYRFQMLMVKLWEFAEYIDGLPFKTRVIVTFIIPLMITIGGCVIFIMIDSFFGFVLFLSYSLIPLYLSLQKLRGLNWPMED